MYLNGDERTVYRPTVKRGITTTRPLPPVATNGGTVRTAPVIVMRPGTGVMDNPVKRPPTTSRPRLWISPGMFMARPQISPPPPPPLAPITMAVPDLYGGAQLVSMTPPAAMPVTQYPVPAQQAQVYPDQGLVPPRALTYAGDDNAPPVIEEGEAPPAKKPNLLPITLALLAAKVLLF